METATSLLIAQLAEYLRGLTRRLDAGAGWYGEFLRRDPEGMRACLDGAAIPPWDVVESLLGDARAVAGEVEYAARLRGAAAAAWDRAPGGAGELRTLLRTAAAQREASQAALRSLTARLGGTPDPAEAAALTREMAWTRDDAARAAGRHEDLTARLAALPMNPAEVREWTRSDTAPASPVAGEPLPGMAPRRRPAAAGPVVEAAPEPPERPPAPGPARAPERPPTPTPEPARAPARDAAPRPAPAPSPARDPYAAEAPGPSRVPYPVPAPGPSRDPYAAEAPDPARTPYDEPASEASPGAGPATAAAPVGRAEGRWLRGGRRSGGGARYAGAAEPEAPADTAPPGGTDAEVAAPRGARFGRPEPRRPHPSAPEPAPPGPDAGAPGSVGPRRTAVFVAGLADLRARGRTGEAHALLCEAAAWPAELLPGLAAELTRAGLAADWATLLWEAASLPPERLAAAAAALAVAGRDADCDALLRQGVARPAAEIADAALALGAAGREREADALLGAFVRLRTAEEAAALARRDPQWFAPRLLRAAGALPGTRQRDLTHALRVAGIATP
ncbi:hypothetical protein [Streptomyces sp. NPDC051577]|uniref:hypothetical protein n=1 Tax=Streptomyces sp. NPDC051577 TaxID=3155166 RepID=UPI00341831C6